MECVVFILKLLKKYKMYLLWVDLFYFHCFCYYSIAIFLFGLILLLLYLMDGICLGHVLKPTTLLTLCSDTVAIVYVCLVMIRRSRHCCCCCFQTTLPVTSIYAYHVIYWYLNIVVFVSYRIVL